MHLMGQWAPGTQNANSPDGEGLGDKLGWFPFPAVEGGAGAPTDVFGGGNGFAVGKDAPPEAVDFLQYATSLDVANRWGETNSGILPVTIGADASITDPNLTGVLEARADASYVQLYLDQAYPPELGAVINDAVAELYAGQASPEQVATDDRGCRQVSGTTASTERRRIDATAGATGRADPAPARIAGPSRAGRSARPGGSGPRSSSSCCPRSPCTSCSSSCRSVRASTTAASTGTASSRSPTSSGCDNYREALADPVFLASLRHVFVIVVLSLRRAAPVRPRPRRPAQPADPRPGHPAAAVLPPVRAVRGDHRRRLAVAAAAQRPRRQHARVRSASDGSCRSGSPTPTSCSTPCSS